MFKEVLFLSVYQMQNYPASEDAVVVSILDRSEAADRPALIGFRDVLRLEFEDTYEEIHREVPLWPDNPTDAEHALFSQGPGERIPSLKDAEQIVTFLAKHQMFVHPPLTLIAHCHGGISRSAAVASWASVRYWAPIGNQHSPDYANPRLLRLLNKAARR
jgi:predicted protein tyrosine phosphatase